MERPGRHPGLEPGPAFISAFRREQVNDRREIPVQASCLAGFPAFAAMANWVVIGAVMDDQPLPTPELNEAKAETAYSAMYDAPSWDQKDLKDDALFYLARALEIAEALGLDDDASRLKARVDNIMGVYDSQFRGNFR